MGEISSFFPHILAPLKPRQIWEDSLISRRTLLLLLLHSMRLKPCLTLLLFHLYVAGTLWESLSYCFLHCWFCSRITKSSFAVLTLHVVNTLIIECNFLEFSYLNQSTSISSTITKHNKT